MFHSTLKVCCTHVHYVVALWLLPVPLMASVCLTCQALNVKSYIGERQWFQYLHLKNA